MNAHRDYEGYDVVWLAADAAGKLAAFTTAGDGPIHVSAIIRQDGSERWAEAIANELAVTSDIRAAEPPASYAERLGRRGFYVYDWGIFDGEYGYRREVEPVLPLAADALPAELAAMIGRLPNLDFALAALVREADMA